MFSAISRLMSGPSRAFGLAEVWKDYDALQNLRAQADTAAPLSSAQPLLAPGRALDNPKWRPPALRNAGVPRRRNGGGLAAWGNASASADAAPFIGMTPWMPDLQGDALTHPVWSGRSALPASAGALPPAALGAAEPVPGSLMSDVSRLAMQQRARVMQFAML